LALTPPDSGKPALKRGNGLKRISYRHTWKGKEIEVFYRDIVNIEGLYNNTKIEQSNDRFVSETYID